jgi:hypothetical protein
VAEISRNFRLYGRIDQHGNANCLGHQVMQEPEPLGHDFSHKKVDAGCIAARPGKAGNQPKLDRINTDAEDGNSGRRGFGCKRGRRATCGDNGHATADEVGHERWQAIVLAIQPVGLHRHVLVLEVAGFI